MPSKIQLDVNLWFLYICLQKSDYKTVSHPVPGSSRRTTQIMICFDLPYFSLLK